MRDIRDDLRDRLETIDGEERAAMSDFQEQLELLHAAHNKRVADLHRARAAVKEMLEVEEQRLSASATTAASLPAVPRLPLVDFLVTQIEKHGPITKEGLRELTEAAGYFSDQVTGRNFHFTLVNLAKHGRIVNKGGDTYEAAEPLPSMFGAGMEGGLMKRIM